jgi:N-acetylmuramoyl-L-alanine amidase
MELMILPLTDDDREQLCVLYLLALCVWREARGEILLAKLAVAWSIRNRVMRPSWWGKTWEDVILKPWQYSSFNAKDPNATKLPHSEDLSWEASWQAAEEAFLGTGSDPSEGATSYHDTSITPPEWTKEMIVTVKIGALIFYRL